jgi:hypothetical protein
MIEWYTYLLIGVSTLAGLVSLILGFLGRKPNDYTMGATALVAVLLVVQLVIAIVSPFVGNPPSGDIFEYYLYLISAILLPIAAGFWALIDSNRWNTVVLGVAAIAVAIMVYRMDVIWNVNGA